MYDKKFTQAEYSAIVDALDKAFDAFRAITKSDVQAETMMREFIEQHYFAVWRAMAPTA